MKIVIYGEGEDAVKLFNITNESLDSIGLKEFVEVSQTTDEKYAKELGVTKSPAFCIEEETLEFKDMIFEGETMSKSELQNLLISIIGGESSSCSSGSCGSSCGGCSHY